MHMVETTVAVAGSVIEDSSVLTTAEQVPPHWFTWGQERPFSKCCVLFLRPATKWSLKIYLQDKQLSDI